MIKVFTGPMFSGKSKKLMEVYDSVDNKNIIQCFKPKKDTRDFGIIKQRGDGREIKATLINNLKEIRTKLRKTTEIIFIDESQFLKGNVNHIINLHLNDNIDVYVSGLSKTSELKPFGLMPKIMAISDEIEILKAICKFCGEDAYYTLYIGNQTKKKILVGNSEYAAVCEKCYKKTKSRKRK